MGDEEFGRAKIALNYIRSTATGSHMGRTFNCVPSNLRL